MPIFREDDPGLDRRNPACEYEEYVEPAPVSIQTPPDMGRWLSRRLSEESIRTELCEGPVPDSPQPPATPPQAISHAVSDRAELIERLKRGESPTWIPNRHLESLFQQNKASSPPRTPEPPASASPSLLPPATITPEKEETQQGQHGIDAHLQEGLNIERPRSALHSGNFTPQELSPSSGGTKDAVQPNDEGHFRPASTSWLGTSPPRDFAPFDFRHGAADYRKEAFKSPGPSSLSSSLSSSFVYQPPTSPLVQSESNDEIDLTLPLNSFNIDANSPRNPRRHTLNFAHSPFPNGAASHRQTPIRRESTFPYQAHQPRRSLNSTPSFPLAAPSPQTPALLRSRRPSFSLEASPLQHASMVGSYEESILRGRMSTTPSKPLEFMAQIGVLGLGKCKSSLRCPPHVTLPFSAVFYSYASTSYGRSKMEEGPSPYVGQIDLENGLSNPDDGQRAKRKLQSRYQDRRGFPEEDPPAHDSPAELSEGDGASRPTKPKRRSRSPKAPPGGRYRIPEKGQLQIIIKNQNKTAVKLYLVPYDLAGMEPGTKTFIRQRSYSAGPIIEADIPNAKDAPAAADRPTLRYLIHLHICCPSKGRYYLYKSIRVVFANRVPDGKERLRNEVTYPDPRFTPYKPIRVMHPPTATVTPAHSITPGPMAAPNTDPAFRRRSAGFAYAHAAPSLYQYQHHGPFRPPEAQQQASQQYNNNPARAPSHTQTTPSAAAGLGLGLGIGMQTETQNGTGIQEPIHQTSQPPQTPLTTMTTTAADMDMPDIEMASPPSTYGKLSKGDAGYGGGNGPRTAAAAAEGLLSQRLRSLGVQRPEGDS